MHVLWRTPVVEFVALAVCLSFQYGPLCSLCCILMSQKRSSLKDLPPQKRLRELSAPPGESSRELLLRALRSEEFRTGKLRSLEALEACCGSRLRQVRRAETCLGTSDVMRIGRLEFGLEVGPEAARRWLAVCGSAVPSSTGRVLNETLSLFARTLGFPSFLTC